MGRKIPGKKHRGVKDPLKQQFERKEKLKLVINAPPSNPNVQEIPKSIIELNRLRNLAKAGNFKKKKKDKMSLNRKNNNLPGVKDNKMPKLKQAPGESDSSYLWRVEWATNELIKEATMEAKHDVVVNRDKSGHISGVKPNMIKDELVLTKGNKSSEKLKTSSASTKAHLQRFKERKELKRLLKKIDFKKEDLEKKKDYVEFGEVVHEPPKFTVLPRGCDASRLERPGRKNLLLKKLLKQPKEDARSISNKKSISLAREEAMQVYKSMKSRNVI